MADNSLDFEKFVRDHQDQLSNSCIPDFYWEALHKKLKDEIFDANDYFTLTYDDQMNLYPVVTHVGGIKKNDPNCVFLIDHAWTYEAEYACAQLESIPGLARRMATLMDLLQIGIGNGNGCEQEENDLNEEKLNDDKYTAKVSLSDGFYTDQDGNELPKENVVELIVENMWRFNQTYQMKILRQSASGDTPQSSSLTEQVSFWYIMDEFGSKIRHSDNPTWRVQSFFYQDRGVSYSVMTPTQDQNHGDLDVVIHRGFTYLLLPNLGDAVTRDFVHGVSDPVLRAAALYPWVPELFRLDDEVNMDNNIDGILFFNAERSRETYYEDKPGVYYLPKKDRYKVYTDSTQVAKSLKEPFELVEDPDISDIVWVAEHIKDFRVYQESGKPFINQFPFENVLTCKDLLPTMVDRVGALHPDRPNYSGTRPPWFQQSFNLNLELPQFVRNFLQRKARNEDNTWIIKPWNLGRSLDTHVSQDLNHIVRLRETGPKIAFKYIHNPVLLDVEGFGKVKFHLRYMSAVTCIDPLIIDVDKVFWIGCANKPFALDEFNVYEKHFTTMNYRSGATFQQILHDQFPGMFAKQYPGYQWSDIEKKVHQIIHDLFEAASCEPGPRGIPHCKVSRAYYALDFMLKWTDDGSDKMQPVLLEVNYNPDCKRLVEYHPDSFHHIFINMFLGGKTPWESVRL